MDGRSPPRVRRFAHRTVLCTLAAITVGVMAWTAWLARPYAKAAVYDYRIRHYGAGYDNVFALGRLHHVAGEATLEQYACTVDVNDERSTLATRALCIYYPKSRVARGVQEYSEIRGRNQRTITKEPWQTDTEMLRNWIKAYFPHPSIDDAYLVLARETDRSDPIEALRLLHTGFHSPDGDARRTIANRFQMTLERLCTADQLESWLDSDCPPHVAPNVAYVVAIKRMRAGRFDDAIPRFQQFLSSLDAEQPELLGNPIPSYTYYNGGGWGTAGANPSDRWELARYQFNECRRLCGQQRQLGSEPDSEKRASILHAIGRRFFHARDLFVNCFYYEKVFSDDNSDGPLGLCDISRDNQYWQACEILLRIVREYPSYSQLEAVEYSIPLCLWRVRLRHRDDVSARLDEAIYCNFQMFADHYPSSSMADDALFLAGIHHWISSGRSTWPGESIDRDTSVLRSNMRRIANDYPDGDVIARYATENPWLEQAILSRRYELDPAAARLDVAALISQLQGWARLLRVESMRSRPEAMRLTREAATTIRK